MSCKITPNLRHRHPFASPLHKYLTKLSSQAAWSISVPTLRQHGPNHCQASPQRSRGADGASPIEPCEACRRPPGPRQRRQRVRRRDPSHRSQEAQRAGPPRGGRGHWQGLRIRRLFHGDEPRHPGGRRGGDAARGAGVLPPAGVGAAQVLLRRPQEGHPAVHELQRAHGEGKQLARLPASALLPARKLRRPVAVEPALIQASGGHLRDGSASAGAAAAGGDLGEPGPGAEPHGGGHGEAGAAHGGELLPAVPAAGAHLRAAGAQGSQCHHSAAPGRRLRPAGAARRPLGRREPRAQRAGHQHRRSAAGTEQRPLQERAPPSDRQQRERADLGADVLLPVAGRGDRTGERAGGRHPPAGLPAIHLPGVLR